MKYLFLWYPKCTVCQKIKKWLDDHNIPYDARDIKLPHIYRADQMLSQRGLPLNRFFNTIRLVYKGLGLTAKLPGMSEEEQIAQIHILIKNLAGYIP